MDSIQLYRDLDNACEDVRAQLKAAQPDIICCYVTSWFGFSKKLHFKIEANTGYDKLAVSIEGTNLQEMTEEAIRRFQFQNQQATLQISQVIDHE